MPVTWGQCGHFAPAPSRRRTRSIGFTRDAIGTQAPARAFGAYSGGSAGLRTLPTPTTDAEVWPSRYGPAGPMSGFTEPSGTR